MMSCLYRIIVEALIVSGKLIQRVQEQWQKDPYFTEDWLLNLILEDGRVNLPIPFTDDGILVHYKRKKYYTFDE